MRGNAPAANQWCTLGAGPDALLSLGFRFESQFDGTTTWGPDTWGRTGKTLRAAGRPGSLCGAPGALPFLPALVPNECGNGRCGKFCSPYINATSYKTATENRCSFPIEGNKKTS